MILIDRVDKLIQYALAVAGQEDPGQRELGPIHLIKYVYLSDLAYANIHAGETFTGAPWRFHDFGPWAAEVFERVEPAAEAVQAARRTFTSARYEGEFSRYQLSDERLLEQLERELPSSITSTLKEAVREFGGDTPSLLNHVYLTRPMLKAAPGERLSFEPEEELGLRPPTPSAAAAITEADAEEAEVYDEDRVHYLVPPTARDRSDLTARIRERLLQKREERSRRSRRYSAMPPPRYDEIYFQGMRALDEAEGGPVDEAEGEVVFSDDIWKSPGRSGSELS